MIPQHDSVLRRLSSEEWFLIELFRSLDSLGQETVSHFVSAAFSRQLSDLPANVIHFRSKR